MEKKEMIDKVYEEIADKTLSEGCKVLFKDTVFTVIKVCYEEIHDNGNSDYVYYLWDGKNWDVEVLSDNTITPFFYNDMSELEIIGNSLHFGYAVDWIEREGAIYKYEGGIFMDKKQELDFLWKDKTKPIEAPENIEALKYLYNLIQEGKN